MVRDELYITVPSPFRCPISMDVMRSPVSLCTGVTYDRSSIQLWLDSGHDTCPATMQILPSKDFIPNLTLRRLINLWAQSNGPPSPRLISAAELRTLESADLSAEALSRIVCLATSGEDNRRILASSDGFLSSIVGIVAGGASKMEASGLESALRVLDLVLLDGGVTAERIRASISKRTHALLASVLVVLRSGKSPESKVAGARVLKSIAGVDEESTRAISENRELMEEVVGLLGGSGSDKALREAALLAVIAIAASRSTKAQLVSSGAVKHVAAVLSDRTAEKGAVEKAMKVAAIVSTCAEGRSELSGAVAAVVERLVKVSREATEEGVTALWNVCCGGGDRKAREAVVRSNGVTKLLLVMQSGCCDRVRRMCSDILRALRAVSSFSDTGNAVVGVESYESRTTHIMHC